MKVKDKQVGDVRGLRGLSLQDCSRRGSLQKAVSPRRSDRCDTFQQGQYYSASLLSKNWLINGEEGIDYRLVTLEVCCMYGYWRNCGLCTIFRGT